MHPDIVMTADFWHALKQHLIRVSPKNPNPDEELAFILASSNSYPNGLRLLAREMLPAAPTDFFHRSPSGLKPRPEFVEMALNRCEKEGWHLIEVHSHPFDTGMKTTFSGTDWQNDRVKMPSIATLLREDFIHATMVVGQNSLDAHYFDRSKGKISPIEKIAIVGIEDGNSQNLRYIATTSGHQEREQHIDNEQYQRQEMFLGRKTQHLLLDTTIAIVGLGGLGSFVALELAHLGVGHLILIDPDRVEKTNLNRLLSTRSRDVGRTKVEVYANIIKDVTAITKVTPLLPLSILDEEAINYAKGADILVGCVDNHGARRILNQIAVRYLVPFVDGGSGIRLADDHKPFSVGGQVQVVLPGIGCLECRGFIDPQRAAFDLASEEEQQYERELGYGMQETAPSVIFLNGVIGSLQIGEVLLLLAGHLNMTRIIPPISLYNYLSREVTPVIPHPFDGCPTCGKEGVVAFGDLAPIRRAPSKSSSLPTLIKSIEDSNAKTFP